MYTPRRTKFIFSNVATRVPVNLSAYRPVNLSAYRPVNPSAYRPINLSPIYPCINTHLTTIYPPVYALIYPPACAPFYASFIPSKLPQRNFLSTTATSCVQMLSPFEKPATAEILQKLHIAKTHAPYMEIHFPRVPFHVSYPSKHIYIYTLPQYIPKLRKRKNMSLKFVIRDPKAKVLFSPEEFFNTLNDMFRNAKERIVISCLYMGIGDLEKELVQSIKNNKTIKKLRVDVLIDKQRGTRPEGKLKESSVSVLSKLFSHGTNVNISLFHNPLLGAILYNILPYRVNEAMGVMHMKVFISDNTLILSGANLSDSYLRNRQDRYLLIENKLLADSVHKIVNTVQKMSFTLNFDLTTHWKSDLMNPLIDSHIFREQFYRRIQYILKDIQTDILEYEQKNLGETWEGDKNSENFLEQSSTTGSNNIGENDQTSCVTSSSCRGKEKTEGGKISNMLRCLKNGILQSNKEKNEQKFKSESKKLIDLSTPCGEKDNFFYPLYEKNKSILVVELALQCAFSIPPIYDESNMLEIFLENIEKYDQSLVISSGYLNFPENFLKLLRCIYDNLTLKRGKIQFITAAPSANSFYKSKGLSNYIPLAYSIIAHTCIEFITKNIVNVFKNVGKKCHLKKLYACTNIYLEYHKPSWTYHSKGMWVINDIKKNNYQSREHNGKKEWLGKTNISKCMTNFCDNVGNCMNKSEYYDNEKKNKLYVHFLNEKEFNDSYTNNNISEGADDLPWGTVMGSSNYGHRATYRDLEMSFVIKTNDDNLKRQLRRELNIIYESSKFVHMNELKLRYPRWLRYIVRFIFRWLL
ncbi:phosphatidylglycerophosphate synthase, putative [Plasmodium ovale wallikeri]|uniref:CDP-diacylglycerol--glycerol-3-phosphate 3-phosphatidyltransferase n=1 Tax=Plasmodium ovale wallikeri TaxID=864142 RepID=A0A1A8YMH4_PLAOA|nr:phosphatidylglycerophosphate synthase, putative [Plasmodium ovale wallikeri]